MSISDILSANAGFEIYSYLPPDDLSNLSLADHHTHNDVHKHLMRLCLANLPLRLGIGWNGQLNFCAGQSFPAKSDLVEHVIQTLEDKEVLVTGTHTKEESSARAREMLKKVGKIGTVVRIDNDDYAQMCGTYIENISNDNAKRLFRSYLRDVKTTSQEFKAIDPWICYILSHPDAVITMWKWRFYIPNTPMVMEEGLIISIPQTAERGMEIKLTCDPTKSGLLRVQLDNSRRRILEDMGIIPHR